MGATLPSNPRFPHAGSVLRRLRTQLLAGKCRGGAWQTGTRNQYFERHTALQNRAARRCSSVMPPPHCAAHDPDVRAGPGQLPGSEFPERRAR